MVRSEQLLPADILARATLRGNEYAWPVGDIPRVIEGARLADLVNIGGQLQLRVPGGDTCECYWVEVDTFKTVTETADWQERVLLTADAALKQYKHLCDRHNFIEEIRSSFGKILQEFEASGGEINDALCFVWYVETEDDAMRRNS